RSSLPELERVGRAIELPPLESLSYCTLKVAEYLYSRSYRRVEMFGPDEVCQLTALEHPLQWFACPGNCQIDPFALQLAFKLLQHFRGGDIDIDDSFGIDQKPLDSWPGSCDQFPHLCEKAIRVGVANHDLQRQQDAMISCSESSAFGHQIRRRSGSPTHATARAASTVQFCQKSY